MKKQLTFILISLFVVSMIHFIDLSKAEISLTNTTLSIYCTQTEDIEACTSVAMYPIYYNHSYNYFENPKFSSENLTHINSKYEFSNIRRLDQNFFNHEFSSSLGAINSTTMTSTKNQTLMEHSTKYESGLDMELSASTFPNPPALSTINVSSIEIIDGNMNSTDVSYLNTQNAQSLRITPALVGGGNFLPSNINFESGSSISNLNSLSSVDGNYYTITPKIEEWVVNGFGFFQYCYRAQIDVVFELSDDIDILYLKFAMDSQMNNVEVFVSNGSDTLYYQGHALDYTLSSMPNIDEIQFTYFQEWTSINIPLSINYQNLLIDRLCGFKGNAQIKLRLNGLNSEAQQKFLQDECRLNAYIRAHNIYSYSLNANNERMSGDSWASAVDLIWHDPFVYSSTNWYSDYRQNKEYILTIEFSDISGFFDIDFFQESLYYTFITNLSIVNFKYQAGSLRTENLYFTLIEKIQDHLFFNASLSQLYYYDSYEEITIPNQALTLGLTLCVNATWNIYHESYVIQSYKRTAPSVFLDGVFKMNDISVSDMGLDSGLCFSSNYLEVLNFSSHPSVWAYLFDIEITSEFSYELDLDVISPTYLMKNIILSDDHAITLKHYSFSTTSNECSMYINSLFYEEKSGMANQIFNANEIISIIVILGDPQYISPISTYWTQISAASTDNNLVSFWEAFRTNRTYAYFSITNNYDVIDGTAYFSGGDVIQLTKSGNQYSFIKSLNVNQTFDVIWRIRPNYHIDFALNSNFLTVHYNADLDISNVTIKLDLPVIFGDWLLGTQNNEEYSINDITFTRSQQTLNDTAELIVPTIVLFYNIECISNEFIEVDIDKTYRFRATINITSNNSLFEIPAQFENPKVYDQYTEYPIVNNQINATFTTNKRNLYIEFDFNPIESYTIDAENGKITLHITSSLEFANALILFNFESNTLNIHFNQDASKYVEVGNMQYYYLITDLTAEDNEIVLTYKTYSGLEWWAYILIFGALAAAVYILVRIQNKRKLTKEMEK